MTRLLFIKLLRDMRATWPRLALMVVALGITLVAFSGILYTWGVTSREIPRAYLSTNPASATILLDQRRDATEMADIARAARGQSGVIEAAARTQLTLQVQQDGGAWGANPIQIFVAAPDDPMRIETVALERGAWPSAVGDLLIDRSSLDLLNVAVGDSLVVQAPNGKPTRLRICGSVYYPGLAPSFQEQKGHGFISTDSLAVLGEPIALDALKIQVADDRRPHVPSRDREAIVARARELAGWLKDTYGVAVREVQIPTPYAHPHQAQADSLLLGLLVFAVAGLALSAVLVATMLNGLFVEHVPQIGIMKAIGARSSRVFQLYLTMTLVIGAVATVLAIIPGIVMSRAFSRAILTLLGVVAETYSPPDWMYGAVVASGIGMPLLLSLAPLLNASRTTVRRALDYRGVDRHGRVSRGFDAGLSRFALVDRVALMAFRNIFRRRARLLLSLGLLASAGAVFVAGTSTMSGFQAFLERDKALRRWDVEVLLANLGTVPAVDVTTIVADLPHVTDVEAWSIVQTSVVSPGERISVTRTYPDQGHGSIAVTVIPRTTALAAPPPLSEGRWLHPEETDAVVISRAVLNQASSSIRTGDMVQLTVGGRPTSWRVVGRADSGGHGSGIYITAAGFTAATGGSQFNLLRLVTASHDEETRTAVAQAAERALTSRGVTVRSAASVSRSEAAGAGHMLPLILVFLGLSAAMGIVGFAGLASTMSANVLERTCEFGVMRAIGARPSTVRRLIVLEGVFIAAVSCLIATIPVLPLTAIMTDRLPVQVPVAISTSGALVWVGVAVLGAAVATAVPAYRASRLSVKEALTYL